MPNESYKSFDPPNIENNPINPPNKLESEPVTSNDPVFSGVNPPIKSGILSKTYLIEDSLNEELGEEGEEKELNSLLIPKPIPPRPNKAAKILSVL